MVFNRELVKIEIIKNNIAVINYSKYLKVPLVKIAVCSCVLKLYLYALPGR